jgi:hypothetical protein
VRKENCQLYNDNNMGANLSKATAPFRILELFCGTGSVGKVAKSYGSHVKVISLDMDPKANPDICVNICKWKYKEAFPKGHFDMIWASPPCNSFSHLQCAWIGRTRKIDGERVTFTKEIMLEQEQKHGVRILNKVKRIIKYFDPENYFIENPQTGRMKNYMTEYQHTDVCYCMYGFDYQKKTRIWHNNEEYLEEGLWCNHSSHKRHIGSGNHHVGTLNERYSIPPALIRSIFNCVPIRRYGCEECETEDGPVLESNDEP